MPRLATFYHRGFESTYGRSITTVDIVPALVAAGETLLLPGAIGGLLWCFNRKSYGAGIYRKDV